MECNEVKYIHDGLKLQTYVMFCVQLTPYSAIRDFWRKIFQIYE